VTWFDNDVTKYAFAFSLCGSYGWIKITLLAISATEITGDKSLLKRIWYEALNIPRLFYESRIHSVNWNTNSQSRSAVFIT